MNDSPLPGTRMTYLEALCMAEGQDVIVFGGDITSSACAHCVRQPVYSNMVKVQVRGTSFVVVTPLHNLPDGMLCSACLMPFNQHWLVVPPSRRPADAPPTP